MIKGKSKFDFEIFYGEVENWLGISKQRYTKDEAIKLWEREMMTVFDDEAYIVEDAFVRYRFGTDMDGDHMSGWWLEWKDYGSKSVPVWSIRSR